MQVLIGGVEYVPRLNLGECRPWAEHLRAARNARGDTLEAAARNMGLSKTYLWELEKGTATEPSLSTIRAILRYTGARFEHVFGVD